MIRIYGGDLVEKITIKKNSLGDSRTDARVPSREEVSECICDNVAAGLSRSGYVFPIEISDEILQKAFANTLEYITNAVEVVSDR